MIMGARVIRRKLKMSSLKTFGLSEPQPLISMNPKINKLRIRIKLIYFFLLKTIFYYCTRKKEKVQAMIKKFLLKNGDSEIKTFFYMMVEQGDVAIAFNSSIKGSNSDLITLRISSR